MKSPIPKERLRVSNWIVRRLLSDCEGRSSVFRQLVYSPPGSLLSTRSTHGRLKMAARKLKAACLRTVFAMQSLQPGACRTIIPPAGRFRYLSSFRLVSLMPRRLPLAASVILCRQSKYGASARQVCVRLPLGGGPALRNAEPPKSDGWPKTIPSRGARTCGASGRSILWQARGTRRCCALRRVPGTAQEQALVLLRQAALRRAESRARISARYSFQVALRVPLLRGLDQKKSATVLAA